MPGGVVSVGNVAVGDNYTPGATFGGSNFDRIDVTATTNDVVFQVLTPRNDWQPPSGQIVRNGIFRSITGFMELYPPGPIQIRFRRAVVGQAATIDLDIYSIDG